MKVKHLVLMNYSLMHYHAARYKAAYEAGKSLGWQVKLYFGRPDNTRFPLADYTASLPREGIQPLHVESDSVSAYQRLTVVRQVLRYLTADKPDAVAILGYNTQMDRATLGWCRTSRKGAILLSESQASDYRRRYLREFLKRRYLSLFDSALVGGTPHMEYASSLGLARERIYTHYDVVDNDFWAEWGRRSRRDPQTWRDLLGLPQRYFLSASRLVAKKNVAGLIRAYARYVAVAESPWPLVIVGDGPLRTELKDLALALGIGQLVHFKGYLHPERLGPIYGLASVFVLASSYSEQWGLVVNEAMAAGLPVLVSAICGCAPDLVLDGITGYTFDPTNESALASLLTLCSSGAVDLSVMGRAANAHIQTFSPKSFAENLITAAETAIRHAQKRLWTSHLPRRV